MRLRYPYSLYSLTPVAIALLTALVGRSATAFEVLDSSPEPDSTYLSGASYSIDTTAPPWTLYSPADAAGNPATEQANGAAAGTALTEPAQPTGSPATAAETAGSSAVTEEPTGAPTSASPPPTPAASPADSIDEQAVTEFANGLSADTNASQITAPPAALNSPYLKEGSYAIDSSRSPWATYPDVGDDGSSNALYSRARSDLPEDLYMLYRIVDRLARANGLDNRPWRFNLISDDSHTDAVSIAISARLLNQLYGDVDALACVVGREMAAQSYQTYSLSEADKKQALDQLQTAAEDEVKQEDTRSISNTVGSNVGRTIIQTIGGFFGGIGGAVAGLTNSALQDQSDQRNTRMQQRIDQIYQARKAQLEQQWADQSRKQILAADEHGYQYVVTAGFKPEGCSRAVEAIVQQMGNRVDNTMPRTVDRQAAVQTYMTQHPPAQLVEQGRSRLSTSQPLTYSVSQNGQSLRVNSRLRNGDIDQLFPQ